MKTAVVNFKTTPEIKQQARKNLEKIGMSLSSYLNYQLHLASENPNTKYQNQLEKDAQSLAKMKFDDLPSEDEWLAIQPIIS